ncbi:TetR/AcrR family transcriptional regulator [Pseudidiomarina marina]|uniref:TetR/AcrR family transcriptional regulator n=1 Tax=Pseudidiomarina marina TaxID=502366 RepID=UPI003850D1DB
MAYRETSRVRERKQATRTNILTNALALLNEVGFGGLQMATLAQRCSVATGTLYRYFPSKEDLCTAVFEHATEIEIAQVQQHLEAPETSTDGLTAADRIADALTTFAKRALRAPVTAWALIAEPVEPAVVAARLRYRERYAGLFAQAIQQGIRDKTLPPQDCALSSRALVGAIAEALIGPLAHKSEFDPNQAITNSVRFCLQAITASSYTDSDTKG